MNNRTVAGWLTPLTLALSCSAALADEALVLSCLREAHTAERVMFMSSRSCDLYFRFISTGVGASRETDNSITYQVATTRELLKSTAPHSYAAKACYLHLDMPRSPDLEAGDVFEGTFLVTLEKWSDGLQCGTISAEKSRRLE